MTRVNTRDRVARYLKRYMRCKKPGEMLPSFRQIMTNCQVGPGTVNEVVREFEKDGLVEVQPQRGIFMGNKKSTAKDRLLRLDQVDLVYFQSEADRRRLAPFHDELLRELTANATAGGQNVRFHLIPTQEEMLTHLDIVLTNSSCEGLVLINLPAVELLDNFHDREIPYVNLFPAVASDMPLNSLLIDPVQVVELQVEHLLALGHRRIGFLHSIREGTFHRDLVLRREAFYRICLDRALPVKSDWIRYAGNKPEERHAVVQQMLSSDQRPTALICADDHLPQVYRAASALGLEIGHQLSVVGTNDDPIAEMLYPAATTAQIPRDEAARVALEMLHESLEAPDGMVPTQHLHVMLKLRDSTGPVPAEIEVPRLQTAGA